MFDFIRKPQPPTIEANNLSFERLTEQLASAIRTQIAAGNLSAQELMKLVQLAQDTKRLRSALTYL
ncbi:MAG: hypothetical protein J6P03_05425 [Opitutales bacterium]|nr:hypothetical protein [Opitutales bacterium]